MDVTLLLLCALAMLILCGLPWLIRQAQADKRRNWTLTEEEQWMQLWEAIRHLPEPRRIEIRNLVQIARSNSELIASISSSAPNGAKTEKWMPKPLTVPVEKAGSVN